MGCHPSKRKDSCDVDNETASNTRANKHNFEDQSVEMVELMNPISILEIKTMYQRSCHSRRPSVVFVDQIVDQVPLEQLARNKLILRAEGSCNLLSEAEPTDAIINAGTQEPYLGRVLNGPATSEGNSTVVKGPEFQKEEEDFLGDSVLSVQDLDFDRRQRGFENLDFTPESQAGALESFSLLFSTIGSGCNLHDRNCAVKNIVGQQSKIDSARCRRHCRLTPMPAAIQQHLITASRIQHH